MLRQAHILTLKLKIKIKILKFKVRDSVKISKYKNIFSKGYN